jgi:hypothetical protein
MGRSQSGVGGIQQATVSWKTCLVSNLRPFGCRGTSISNCHYLLEILTVAGTLNGFYDRAIAMQIVCFE